MGVNIFMVKPKIYPSDHPDWDWTRQSGDRVFWDVCKGLEFDEVRDDGFPIMSDYVWYRPKDFAAFRAAPWPDEYARRRWHHAADLLEADPEYWLYFGY